VVYLPNLMESQSVALFSTNWSPHYISMPLFNIHEHKGLWTAHKFLKRCTCLRDVHWDTFTLKCAEQKATWLSPQQATNSPYPYAHCFLKIHFNIFPVTCRFPK
jgi:hypothetical protein